MIIIECKCLNTLTDDSPTTKLLEWYDPNEFDIFTDKVIKYFMEFSELKVKEKRDWILKQYNGYEKALSFSDKAILEDLIFVDRPTSEIWKCLKCGRLWMEENGQFKCFKME
ncbi:hypothetical protein OO013_13680 [Mangrovivirga sp. M17]|uniref:Uncharacterized protein n=1 Tax=Mangrovivirga halotolerans TaxID=2993936 RepID=A0ABT3RUA6_9BACT|nr:hypothetical protein [Mangrovivirga halotolerans]MCX2744928.1 hypothetical protein [Mangrovivirga halotolerans]